MAPCNSSNISSNLGMGCLYLMMMLLMALQSQHIRNLPSFFGTNNTRTTQGLKFFAPNLYPRVLVLETLSPLFLWDLSNRQVYRID